MVTTTHPLPAVHTHKTDEEMVIEVEVPAGERRIEIEIENSALTVHVPVPPKEHRTGWNPDAAAC